MTWQDAVAASPQRTAVRTDAESGRRYLRSADGAGLVQRRDGINEWCLDLRKLEGFYDWAPLWAEEPR